MITADEAFEQSTENAKRINAAQVKSLEEKISIAISRGEFEIFANQLTQPVMQFLESQGYRVISQASETDTRSASMYKISWRRES